MSRQKALDAFEPAGGSEEQAVRERDTVADALSYALRSLEREASMRLLSPIDSQMDAQVLSSAALEHKLRAALELEQFELHYQPTVNAVTGAIEGAAALLRWNESDIGYVAPTLFVPTLEASGLIREVSDWAIGQAARDSRAWRIAGLPPVRVAVTVSPRQLQRQDLVQLFAAANRDLPGPNWGLDIEITAMDDVPRQTQVLHALHDAGVRIAIDDFGIGFSSLARLAELPIDTLKINRSFVAGLNRGPKGHALAKAVIDVGRALEMTTIAEGVEDIGQLRELRLLGCDRYQGFLHSKPMTAVAWARWIHVSAETPGKRS